MLFKALIESKIKASKGQYDEGIDEIESLIE